MPLIVMWQTTPMIKRHVSLEKESQSEKKKNLKGKRKKS